MDQEKRGELKRAIIDIMVSARHNNDRTYGEVAEEILALFDEA